MKILLLGVGMQGTVALDDLMRSDEVTAVVAADADLDGLRSRAEAMGYDSRLSCERFDAADVASIDRLFSQDPDVVIDLLPVDFIPVIAERAIRHRVHLVNTFFVPDTLRTLEADARGAGVAILPELGMDPGIDLVLMGDTVRGMDEVFEVHSYGGGIPAPEAANNAIRYKISWTFEGVLRAYHHPSRVIVDGRRVDIPADELFRPEHIHEVDIADLGRMEAYTNGDALEYCEALGLDLSSLRATGRYSLRWPGHSEFWRKIVDLHLLDDEPVVVGGSPVDRIKYLTAALEPHLRYEDDEDDLAIIRVIVAGRRDGREVTVTHDVIARRDRSTGFTAMGRLVGFTASAGARMLARGEISARGLLSPMHHVPARRLLSELEHRGIVVSTTERLAP